MNSMTSGKGTTLRYCSNRSSTKYSFWPTLITGRIRISFLNYAGNPTRCIVHGVYPLHLVPYAAIKEERGDDRLWRAVCRKYLARNHRRSFSPFQGEPLVGKVLAK